MAGQKTYTIGEAAKTIEVEGKNSSTVRLWTEMFADWLSPLTRPMKGQLRLYTPDDLLTLTTIRDLRRQHIPYEEIRSRLAAGTVEEAVPGEGEVTETGEAPAEIGQVVGVDELRDLLAPVGEVAETLRHFLRDYDSASTRLRMEVARLSGTITGLEEGLDTLQQEMRALSLQLNSPGQQGDLGGGHPGEGAAVMPTPLPDPPPSRSRTGRQSPTEEQPSGPIVRHPRQGSPDEGKRGRCDPEPALRVDLLNEYGLRPFPARLMRQSLGSLYLCRLCGSTTRPLGLTPTARAVLACIECGERITVPVDKLEKALGVPRGFWSRLWDRLKRPFSRSR